MTAKPVHVRTATLGDYDVLVALFDELDELSLSHSSSEPDERYAEIMLTSPKATDSETERAELSRGM